jgi:serine/threonine-protein phosphatase 2A regulatory subunit A
MFKAIDSVGEAAVLRKTAHPHESKEYRHRPTSSSMSGLMPIAVLIDELKHEDVVVRMNSFQKIDVIAKGLGADRTRNEFIPFLSAFLEEEDEDVLVILAGKLPKLVPVIGGISAAEPVLNLLKGLCVVDENVVYEAAVESIVEIAKLDSEKSIQTFIYNLIVKLIESGLSNAKRAVCALIPALCPMLQDDAQRNLVVYAFGLVFIFFPNYLL